MKFAIAKSSAGHLYASAQGGRIGSENRLPLSVGTRDDLR